MNDRIKDVATGAATAIAAKGFQRWMDRYDAKPVFRAKLVRRFRRFFGLNTTAERQEAHDEMLRAVQRAVDEYKGGGK